MGEVVTLAASRGMDGYDEQAEAKRWAVINAARMKAPIVIVGYPNHNSASYTSSWRSWMATRPVTAALLYAAAGATGMLYLLSGLLGQ